MDIIQIIMLVWGFCWGLVWICVTCGAILVAVEQMIERWVRKHDSTESNTERD